VLSINNVESVRNTCLVIICNNVHLFIIYECSALRKKTYCHYLKKKIINAISNLNIQFVSRGFVCSFHIFVKFIQSWFKCHCFDISWCFDVSLMHIIIAYCSVSIYIPTLYPYFYKNNLHYVFPMHRSGYSKKISFPSNFTFLYVRFLNRRFLFM